MITKALYLSLIDGTPKIPLCFSAIIFDLFTTWHFLSSP
jgi:hypothetical protein